MQEEQVRREQVREWVHHPVTYKLFELLDKHKFDTMSAIAHSTSVENLTMEQEFRRLYLERGRLEMLEEILDLSIFEDELGEEDVNTDGP